LVIRTILGRGGPDYPGVRTTEGGTPWHRQHTKNHHSIIILMYYNNNFNGKYWAIVGPRIVRTTQGSRLPGPHYRRTTVLLIQTVFFYLWKPKGYFMYQHSKILHSSHKIFMSFGRVSGNTSKFSLYNPQRQAFITEVASVYCAVRPGPLNKMDYVSSFNG